MSKLIGLHMPLRAFCVGCGQMGTFNLEEDDSGSMVCEREACPEFGKTVYFGLGTGVIERVEEPVNRDSQCGQCGGDHPISECDTPKVEEVSE